jgi:PadR family transcriptional regulator PadR
MVKRLQMTTATAKVLRIFLDDPDAPRYGFEIMQRTGLPSGTLYPILARLERAGWLTSRREETEATVEGRPARTFYTLSSEGLAKARHELAALTDALRPPETQSWPRSAGGQA